MVLCRSQNVHSDPKYFNNSFSTNCIFGKVIFVYDILNVLLVLEIYDSWLHFTTYPFNKELGSTVIFLYLCIFTSSSCTSQHRICIGVFN